MTWSEFACGGTSVPEKSFSLAYPYVSGTYWTRHSPNNSLQKSWGGGEHFLEISSGISDDRLQQCAGLCLRKNFWKRRDLLFGAACQDECEKLLEYRIVLWSRAVARHSPLHSICSNEKSNIRGSWGKQQGLKSLEANNIMALYFVISSFTCCYLYHGWRRCWKFFNLLNFFIKCINL